MKEATIVKVFKDWGSNMLCIYFLPEASGDIKSEKIGGGLEKGISYDNIHYGRSGSVQEKMDGLCLNTVLLNEKGKIVKAYIDLDKVICKNPF